MKEEQKLPKQKLPKQKLPIDFSEITQEEIDNADSYKKIDEYNILDLLKAIVDSEKEKEENNNE